MKLNLLLTYLVIADVTHGSIGSWVSLTHDPIDPFPGLMSVDFEQCFESNTTVQP